MKKMLAMLLTLTFLLTITACNINNTPEKTSDTTSANQTTTDSGKTNEQNGYTSAAPILFKARIAFSSGQSFYAKGFQDENGRETFTGYVYFPAEIDLTDYKDGDYVEIGYDGWAMETYPLQANALSIRHLTEEEIVEIQMDEKTCTLTLQYMGRDENELIGISSTAYSIDLDTLENIPDMNFKDYFTVVYDGTKCSFFISATRIPFVKEIYRSDSRGNRIG